MRHSRSYLRAQERRAKKRASALLELFERGLSADERLVGLFSHTRKPCSCYLCNNQKRKWSGPTRQELVRW